MKKPFLIFASVILATLSYGAVVSLWAESSVVAATSVVKLYVTPASAGVTSGYTTSLQLRLNVNSAAKVDYADARLTFSAANLEVVSISKQGSYFNYGNGPSVSFNNSNGLLSVTGSGPVVNSPTDVLLATIVVKGKAAGSGAISYTADSQVGDITSGGHVKDALTSRVGATINVSNPPASPPASGNTGTSPTSGSPSPTTTTPTATTAQPTDSAPATTAEDQTSTAAADSSSNGQPTTVAAAIEKTVTAPPVWLKFLLPITALVGIIGAGSLGYVLYKKRLQSGVTLPDETAEAEVMPSTEETAEGTLNPDFAVGMVDESEAEAEVMESSEPELPEFSANESLEPPVLAEEPVPSALDSVLSQPPELIPEEMRSVADQYTVPAAPPAPEPVQPLPTVAEAEIAPRQLDEVLPPEMPNPATVAPLPVSVPVAPVMPQVSQLPIAPAPVASEVTAVPGIAVESQPVPPIVPVSPATQPIVNIDIPPQTIAAAAAPVAPLDHTDYKNMPDMYELGEQRLKNEGFGETTQPAVKPQTV